MQSYKRKLQTFTICFLFLFVSLAAVQAFAQLPLVNQKEVASLFGTSKAVDTDFFATEMGVQRLVGNSLDPIYHVIDISLPTGAVVNVMRSGNQTVTEALNSGVALTGGSAYRFTIVLHRGDTYNLQYTGIAGPQDVTCRIQESINP